MATQNFSVSLAEGIKALPIGTKRFTQNNRATAYLYEGTNNAEVTGEEIYKGVPYALDPAIQYYIRVKFRAAEFGIVVE